MKKYSPLRYPGGKANLINNFKLLIQQNNLQSITYVEPFAGGANIALSLLIDNYVSNIVINDIDYAVYSFWYSVLNNSQKLINKIIRCEINIEEWKKQKEIINNQNKYDLFTISFAFLFLNRTNFSGIIKGGPIGGIEQKGKYKIDARFNKADIINKIKLINKYRDRILLLNLDVIELIKYIKKGIGSSLIYFDPPYYQQGKNLYMNFYNDNDHEKLSKLIYKLNNPLVVTYDNNPFIKNLYKKFNSHKFSINYSAYNHSKGKELMFYKNLNMTNFKMRAISNL